MAKKKKIDKHIQLANRTVLDDNFAPIIHNLLSEGFNLAEVGLLLGYAGKDSQRWLKRLSEGSEAIQKAVQEGIDAANVKLIQTAFKAAIGYFVTEEEVFAEVEKVIPPPNVAKHGPDAPARKPYYRFANKSKKTKKRFIEPNTQLLFKLLCNRLPEYFSDSRKIEIDKRSVELKANVEQEIKDSAGALLDAAGIVEKKKRVTSQEIKETKNE